MKDNLTFKNREKWVGYAEKLRELNYALNNMSDSDGAKNLLLNSVNFREEMIDIEKKSDPLNKAWDNVDLSIIKIDGYYKAIEGSRSFDWDKKTIYYHVLDESRRRPDFLELEQINISGGGVWAKLKTEDNFYAEEFYKKTFAIGIIDRHIVECTKDEWNEAELLYKNIKKTFNDSRR